MAAAAAKTALAMRHARHEAGLLIAACILLALTGNLLPRSRQRFAEGGLALKPPMPGVGDKSIQSNRVWRRVTAKRSAINAISSGCYAGGS